MFRPAPHPAGGGGGRREGKERRTTTAVLGGGVFCFCFWWWFVFLGRHKPRPQLLLSMAKTVVGRVVLCAPPPPPPPPVATDGVLDVLVQYLSVARVHRDSQETTIVMVETADPQVGIGKDSKFVRARGCGFGPVTVVVSCGSVGLFIL